MSIYFSEAQQAFFDDTVHTDIPPDAVAVAEGAHLPLLAKLNQGCRLSVADGRITATDPRPSAHHHWDGTAWTISPEAEAALKAARQAEMWERIKQKRHDNLRGGVYIKSIGKWMHSNDESRTQYIALGLLPALPPELRWKTMENDFVPMSKALLQEIYLTMLADEQADFANAERHKAAMEATENPLEYDYSDGWTQTYQPPAPSAATAKDTKPAASADGNRTDGNRTDATAKEKAPKPPAAASGKTRKPATSADGSQAAAESEAEA